MPKKYEPKYWNHQGRLQKRYDELYAILVPDSGDAPTTIGQMLRYMSKIYYDIYNNGGCNLDMDYFKDGGAFLNLHYRTCFKEIARELKIKDFSSKLEMFPTNDTCDKDNDEIVDVIVTYVDREYCKNDDAKLINSAMLAASLLVGNAPELAEDLRKLVERVKNGQLTREMQVPAV